MTNTSQNESIRDDIDPVIEELVNRGIKHNDHYEVVGLGDVVEEVLNKFGITQDRFKQFFNLKECDCTERKKWLNSVLFWHKEKHDDNSL